jgi:predicted glutamine amidotransferase
MCRFACVGVDVSTTHSYYSTTRYYSSTTPYYSSTTPYYSSTTPYYSSTTPYYSNRTWCLIRVLKLAQPSTVSLHHWIPAKPLPV